MSSPRNIPASPAASTPPSAGSPFAVLRNFASLNNRGSGVGSPNSPRMRKSSNSCSSTPSNTTQQNPPSSGKKSKSSSSQNEKENLGEENDVFFSSSSGKKPPLEEVKGSVGKSSPELRDEWRERTIVITSTEHATHVDMAQDVLGGLVSGVRTPVPGNTDDDKKPEEKKKQASEEPSLISSSKNTSKHYESESDVSFNSFTSALQTSFDHKQRRKDIDSDEEYEGAADTDLSLGSISVSQQPHGPAHDSMMDSMIETLNAMSLVNGKQTNCESGNSSTPMRKKEDEDPTASEEAEEHYQGYREVLPSTSSEGSDPNNSFNNNINTQFYTSNPSGRLSIGALVSGIENMYLVTPAKKKMTPMKEHEREDEDDHHPGANISSEQAASNSPLKEETSSIPNPQDHPINDTLETTNKSPSVPLDNKKNESIPHSSNSSDPTNAHDDCVVQDRQEDEPIVTTTPFNNPLDPIKDLENKKCSSTVAYKEDVLNDSTIKTPEMKNLSLQPSNKEEVLTSSTTPKNKTVDTSSNATKDNIPNDENVAFAAKTQLAMDDDNIDPFATSSKMLNDDQLTQKPPLESSPLNSSLSLPQQVVDSSPCKASPNKVMNDASPSKENKNCNAAFVTESSQNVEDNGLSSCSSPVNPIEEEDDDNVCNSTFVTKSTGGDTPRSNLKTSSELNCNTTFVTDSPTLNHEVILEVTENNKTASESLKIERSLLAHQDASPSINNETLIIDPSVDTENIKTDEESSKTENTLLSEPYVTADEINLEISLGGESPIEKGGKAMFVASPQKSPNKEANGTYVADSNASIECSNSGTELTSHASFDGAITTIDPVATKSKIALDDENIDPFATKSKIAMEDENVDPFTTKSKIVIDDENVNPFATKSKIAMDEENVDPFVTKSKIAMDNDNIESKVALDDENVDPFATKSKIAMEDENVDPFATKSKIAMEDEIVDPFATKSKIGMEDEIVDPFATKSNIAMDDYDNVDSFTTKSKIHMEHEIVDPFTTKSKIAMDDENVDPFETKSKIAMEDEIVDPFAAKSKIAMEDEIVDPFTTKSKVAMDDGNVDPFSIKTKIAMDDENVDPFATKSKIAMEDENIDPFATKSKIAMEDEIVDPFATKSKIAMENEIVDPFATKSKIAMEDENVDPFATKSKIGMDDENVDPFETKSKIAMEDENIDPFATKSKIALNDDNVDPFTTKSKISTEDENVDAFATKSKIAMEDEIVDPFATKSNIAMEDENVDPFATNSKIAMEDEIVNPFTTKSKIDNDNVDPFATKTKITMDDENVDPFATKSKISTEDENVDPFAIKSKIAMEAEIVDPFATKSNIAMEDENVDPFATNSKIAMEDEIVNPFTTKSKIAIDNDNVDPFTTKTKIAMDDENVDPFATKSKIAMDDENVDPFATKTKIPLDDENVDPFATNSKIATDDENVDPFATKSKIAIDNDAPSQLDNAETNIDASDEPQSNKKSGTPKVPKSPHKKDSTPEFEATEKSIEKESSTADTPKEKPDMDFDLFKAEASKIVHSLESKNIDGSFVGRPHEAGSAAPSASDVMSSIQSCKNSIRDALNNSSAEPSILLGSGGDFENSVSLTSLSNASVSQVREHRNRNELMCQAKLLEMDKEHHQIEKEIASADQVMEQYRYSLAQSDKSTKQMMDLIERYEKTAMDIIRERDRDRAIMDIKREKLLGERSTLFEDRCSSERANHDVWRKYERMREVISDYKQDEDEMKDLVKTICNKYEHSIEKYSVLKSHVEEKLKEANVRYEDTLRINQSEIAKLQAIFRKAEMKSESLERTLVQKKDEFKELNIICDELINNK